MTQTPKVGYVTFGVSCIYYFLWETNSFKSSGVHSIASPPCFWSGQYLYLMFTPCFTSSSTRAEQSPSLAVLKNTQEYSPVWGWNTTLILPQQIHQGAFRHNPKRHDLRQMNLLRKLWLYL